MSKQVLVAGVNGFVGHHVARELAGLGHTVIGTAKDPELEPELSQYVSEFIGGCDLTNPADVAQLPLQNIDAVINLAGLTNVGASFEPGQAERYIDINVSVHTTLVEQLREIGKKDVRIIAVSTGAVYDPNQNMPLTEESQLAQDGSPYVLSKLKMERELKPFQELGHDIIVVRPFNHIGPGQAEGLLVPDLIKKLREIGPDKTLRVGQLDNKRDFTDVRDVAHAYCLLATADSAALNHKLYNVCRGVSHTGEEILSMLANILGIEQYKTVIDEAHRRPAGKDPQNLYGDSARLRLDTGWEPCIELDQTLRDALGS